MDKLDILEQSTVFCAYNSVKNLKDKKFSQAYSDWDAAKMNKIQFF